MVGGVRRDNEGAGNLKVDVFVTVASGFVGGASTPMLVAAQQIAQATSNFGATAAADDGVYKIEYGERKAVFGGNANAMRRFGSMRLWLEAECDSHARYAGTT
jgi:hypothetical protein